MYFRPYWDSSEVTEGKETERWPHPSQSWDTLAWPTTRWLLKTTLPLSPGEMGGWGVVLWPESQPSCSLHQQNAGSEILRVKGFSGLRKQRQAGRGRSPLIQSQVLIYHSPCMSSVLGTGGYNCMKRFDLCSAEYVPPYKGRLSEQIITV